MRSLPMFCVWVMAGAGVQAVQAVFLLLLVFVAVFAGLARRLKVAYPILLVIAGLMLSFVPEMPRIGLDPDLVFLVFLPPLLYSAAWTLSWRVFQRNFASIAMLAVGLVFFTVVGLAMAAGTLLPGFDWRSAVLLGAVVAATDAIAATSIARRVGLPQRIVDILEAESLVLRCFLRSRPRQEKRSSQRTPSTPSNRSQRPAHRRQGHTASSERIFQIVD
jgi:CPA1 family monovalent cation:H+ antiporter